MLDQTSPQLYTDFSSLTGLRRQAREDPQATLRAVARQFEGLDLNMMLKSMRQASLGDPIFDSSSSGLYRDMYDKQIALQMSQQQGIGLADMLVKQLQTRVPVRPERPSLPSEVSSLTVAPAVKKQASQPDPIKFESHEAFVNYLWPKAEAASEELGVSPQALIAQAVLETGWGQHIHRLPNGKSSYNLFNIKADSRWDGQKVTVSTLEYSGGIAEKQKANFRAYGSYQESFDDYIHFLKNNPRYTDALQNAEHAASYVKELQQAGYATDPNYANKVINIMQREVVGAPYTSYLSDTGGV